MEATQRAGDDVVDLVASFTTRLALDDAEEAQASTSKMLTKTQRAIESCGWTSFSMEMDRAKRGSNSREVYEDALARLMRARAATQSKSKLRLWWLCVLEITSALREKSDATAAGVWDDVCQTLMEDVSGLAKTLGAAPDREMWAEIMDEVAQVNPVVASREKTLTLAARGLYALVPDAFIKQASVALKARQNSQIFREELYWVLFTMSAIDPLDSGGYVRLVQLLEEFNPAIWGGSYRKSDFRHYLSTMLTVILCRCLSRKRPERGSVDLSVVRKVQADVVKWLNDNEKKHTAAGLPLLGALAGLELTQEMTSPERVPQWRIILESRILNGIDQKLKISSFLRTVQGIVLGISMEQTEVVTLAVQSLATCVRAMKRSSVMSDEPERAFVLAGCALAFKRTATLEDTEIMALLQDGQDDVMLAAFCVVCADILRSMNVDQVLSNAALTEFIDGGLQKLTTTNLSLFSPVVTAAALSCSRFVEPSKISSDMIDFACTKMAHSSVIVRNDAESFLLHAMREKSELRDGVLQALSSCILNLREFLPAERLSAISSLVKVCKTWNAALQSESNRVVQCNVERAEAAALLLVCDADFSVRQNAIEALKEISSLNELINSKSKSNVNAAGTSVYSVLKKYLEIADLSTFIREVSHGAALECSAVYTTAHAQAYQKIQALMVAEGDGKNLVVPIKPSEYKYNLWLNYMIFVCSAETTSGVVNDTQQVVTIGHRGSLSGLLKTVMPRLGQSTGEVDTIMRLFRVLPSQSKSMVLTALLPSQSILMKSTFASRSNREGFNMLIRFGQVYQDYAVNGVFSLTPDLTQSLNAAVDFVLMVCSHLKTMTHSQAPKEINQLKFSAATILSFVLDDGAKVGTLPAVTQAELWKNLHEWQESSNPLLPTDMNVTTSREYIRTMIQEFAYDYRRAPTEGDVSFASREALASLSAGEHFSKELPKQVLMWVNKLVELSNDSSMELARRVTFRLLQANHALFESSLDFCYSSSEDVSNFHMNILSELGPLALKSLPTPQLISVVLHKMMSSDQDIQSSSGALLAIIQAKCGVKRQRTDRVEIKDEAQLGEECELIIRTDTQPVEEILLETWKRRLDGTGRKGCIQSKLCTSALIPWISALHLPHLMATGKADEVLLGLFRITTDVSEHQWDTLSGLWEAIGAQPRNVVPAIRFLQEIVPRTDATGRDKLTLKVAKAACGWLVRTSPQQAIDQLVYTITFRALDSDENDASKVAPRDSSPQAVTISSADVGIILLSQLAIDHREDFRFHLPVLAHAVVVTLIVVNQPVVRQHCGELLCNLAAGKSGGVSLSKTKDPVYRMMRLFIEDDAYPWKLSKIRRLIDVLPRAIDLDENLPQRWANEGRRWILRSPSFSLACASAKTLIFLNAPLDEEAFRSLLSATCMCAAMSGESLDVKKREMASDLAQCLLKTLSTSLWGMDPHKVLMYTPVFWCGAMCLRTYDEALYSCAIDVLCVFLYKCPLDDSSMTFDVITSCAPLPRGSYYPEIPMVESYAELLSIIPEEMPKPEISWNHFVLLVLKGLFKSSTFARSVRVLAMLVPNLSAHHRWNGVELSVLISYALIPLVLAAVEDGSSAAIGDIEARTIAHRIAQGLRRIDTNLSSSLLRFSSTKNDRDGALLTSAFVSTLAGRPSDQSHLPVHWLREFSLCADSSMATKILEILSKTPKTSKSINRDFSDSWSATKGEPTMADASYGVLLSARLETDSKSSVPTCLE